MQPLPMHRNTDSDQTVSSIFMNVPRFQIEYGKRYRYHRLHPLLARIARRYRKRHSFFSFTGNSRRPGYADSLE